MKVQAFFKKSAPAAPAKGKAGTAKKTVAKPSSGTRSGKWLGKASESTDLSRWYGEWGECAVPNCWRLGPLR